MNYLERNAALAAEINDEIKHGLVFDKQFAARSRSGTIFSTLGSYDSEVLGRRLHLGLKEYKETRLELTTAITLAIVRAIIETVPEYESEIPVMHGRLLHDEGEEKGLIVEDVSEGGRKGVREVNTYLGKKEGQLPEKLRIINPHLDDEELAITSFRVGENGERKLLDLLGLRYGFVSQDLIEHYPFTDIYNDIGEHTVFTQQKI